MPYFNIRCAHQSRETAALSGKDRTIALLLGGQNLAPLINCNAIASIRSKSSKPRAGSLAGTPCEGDDVFERGMMFALYFFQTAPSERAPHTPNAGCFRTHAHGEVPTELGYIRQRVEMVRSAPVEQQSRLALSCTAWRCVPLPPLPSCRDTILTIASSKFDNGEKHPRGTDKDVESRAG